MMAAPSRSIIMAAMVSRLHRSGWAFVAALVLCAPVGADDVSLTASLDRPQVEMGQPVTLTLALSGDLTTLKGLPKAKLPDSFQIVAQSQSSNFAIRGGVVERSVSFYYVLLAREAGTFTLGPFEMERKQGNPLTSEPVKVVVRKPIVPPGSQPAERFIL